MPHKVQRDSSAASERELQKVLSALSSPIRREILNLIWEREVPAGEIAAAFSVTKPTISQHLAVLREAGLVTSTAVGTSRLYRAKQESLHGLRGALTDAGKWLTADDIPERLLPTASTKFAVVVGTQVDAPQPETFEAFVDPEVYSRWLGVPVSIKNGRFVCTLEWGTQVRGRYEVISPPELIAMRWDFEDDNISLPGGEMTAYLRVTPCPEGTNVEVHQLVDTQAQAEFIVATWSLVLGRLKTGLAKALDPAEEIPPRPWRPKRRTGSNPELPAD
jgi:DNA-binding transcriptional ArsR family regulator/uncharacterized protein YndB with AHSA1/START domain